MSKRAPFSTQDLDVISSESGAQLQGVSDLHASEIKKRSLRGAFSYVMRTFLLTGISAIALVILGAKIQPSDYGVYGIVVAISGFFTIISDIGLAASLIQQKEAPTRTQLRTVFTVQQILAWIVFILILLVSVGLLRYGKLSKEGVYLALAFGISFPIVSLKTISSILLERDLHFDKLIIPAIVESVVFNGLLVVLAFRGMGVMSFTYAVFFKAACGVISMMFIKRWDVGFAFSWAEFKKLMRVGGGFQLNDMLAKTKDDLFYISVALIIPQQEYGYITWAKQWSRLPYSLTVDNITALTFPAFSRLQHDANLLRKAIEKTIFFVTLVAFPLLGGLSVMIVPFTHVIPEYVKWQPALLTMALFSFSLAFAAFSTPLISTLNAIGKISISLKMMVFWTVAQWALAPFLLKWFGFQAVALIAAILAFSSLFVVALVKKYVSFNFLDQVWRQSFATICMVIALWELRSIWERSLLTIVLGVVCGGCIFGTLMLITGYKKIVFETKSLLKK